MAPTFGGVSLQMLSQMDKKQNFYFLLKTKLLINTMRIQSKNRKKI